MDIKDITPWAHLAAGDRAPTAGGDPMRSLQSDINRAFEAFWQAMPAARFRAGWDVSFNRPALDVDVAETDRHVIILAELPGLEEGDIEVLLGDGQVTICGEKRSDREGGERRYVISERVFGSIRRSIVLPAPVDDDAVTATFHNGVLQVTIEKRQDDTAPARRITVNKT